MKYLGIVMQHDGSLTFPDAAVEGGIKDTYEAVAVGGDILLLASSFDRQRVERVRRLARRSIAEHKQALKGLAT